MTTQVRNSFPETGFRVAPDWESWFADGLRAILDEFTSSGPDFAPRAAGRAGGPKGATADSAAAMPPTITTDLADYAPGSTAYIAMSGVEAGATVRFEIDHVSDPGADGVWGTFDDITAQLGGAGHDPWHVTDGGAGDLDGRADGTIRTSWHVNPDDSLNERFLLTGHAVESGGDGALETADDVETGAAASTTFTDSGGDYSLDFAVGDPSKYSKMRPSDFPIIPIGRSDDPLPGAADGTAKESLSPKELALGQIVPFEVEITTGSSASFTGTVEFTVAWSTTTSNNTEFGYDESIGLLAAFVDGLDAATLDPDATVSALTWTYDAASDEIVGTVTVSNLDPDSSAVVELWVAIDPVIEPGTNGNVPARLVSAREIGTNETISTGAQTVPLLKVSEFITGSTELSITVSDEPNDAVPVAGDDPEPVLRAGDQFAYTILATNNSTDTVANGVVLTDALDANVTFVSATVNGAAVTGVYDSATHAVTIDLGFLERADSAELDLDNNAATILITVEVNAGVAPGASFSNTATITSLTSEATPADNTDSETTVLAANAAPVAADDSGTVAEDVTLTVAAVAGLLANDSDAEGHALAVTQFTVDGVTHLAGETASFASGSLTVNADGSYSFVPAADVNGAVAPVAYTVADSFGATGTAVLDLSVTPVNDLPVAANDSAATNEDTSVTLDVLANDDDADGDALTVTSVGGLVGGTAAINLDGTVSFTPTTDFTGAGGFTYTISDGNGGTATATASVTVALVNDLPVAADDSAATNEDTAVTLDVLANDSDDADGDSLTVTAVSALVGGTAAINLDGTVSFTPTTDFTGAGGFTYTVSDGNGGTATATASVTVAPVNDLPVAADDSANTASDATVDIVLTRNDTDPDGDDLDILSIDTTGVLGSVTILDGDTVRYDPNGAFDHLGQGETATETFTYIVSDGNGGTATATASVTIGGVNDAPVATDDVAGTEQAQPVIIDVLGNDSDPNTDPLSVSGNTDPANGTLVLNADGTFTYDPDDAFFGADSFDYTISDGRGASSTATVTIDVERNLAPSIPEPIVFFTPENQTRAADLLAIDPEDDPVAYSIVGGPDEALFTIDAATGALDFVTAPDFEAPTDADGDNTYQVRVGLQDALHAVSQTVTVNVTDVADTPNRVPVITNTDAAEIEIPLFINQQGMILDIDATDPDGDTLVFTLFGNDAGKFSLDAATGELTLPVAQTDPRGSFDDDFIFELEVLVEDGNGGQATLLIDYLLFTSA